MEDEITSQTSMVQLHSWGMWLLFHAGIEVKPFYQMKWFVLQKHLGRYRLSIDPTRSMSTQESFPYGIQLCSFHSWDLCRLYHILYRYHIMTMSAIQLRRFLILMSLTWVSVCANRCWIMDKCKYLRFGQRTDQTSTLEQPNQMKNKMPDLVHWILRRCI